MGTNQKKENKHHYPQPDLLPFQQSNINIFPGGTVGISLAGDRVLFLSDGLCDLLGYEKEETNLLQSSYRYFRIIHPDDLRRVNREIRNHIQQKNRIELSCRLINKAGNIIWVKVFGGVFDSPHWGVCLLFLFLDDSSTQKMIAKMLKTQDEMDTLINTIPGGVARLDINDGFRILTASEGYYKMTGYTEEESHGAPVYDRGANLSLQEDLPVIAESVERLLKTGDPINVSYRIRKKDNSIAWNTAYCSKIDVVEDTQVVDAVFIDTTAIKTTESQLYSLINSIPCGVVRVHIHQDIIIDYANDEFYRQTGYSKAEFDEINTKNSYLHIVHPNDREMLLDRASFFTTSDVSCPSIDYRIITKSGEIRWMQASASRVNDGLNTFKIAQCIIMDITADRERKRQIAISSERYRIIAEQMQDIIYEWDIRTGVLHHSSVFEKKFGYSLPDDFPIKDLLTTGLIYEEDIPLVSAVVETVQNGVPYLEVDYRIRKWDNSYIWCRNTLTTVFDEDGRPLQVIGIIKDIEQYKRETASLQEKAMRDSLTGLLNRRSLEEKIQSHLEKSPPDSLHAFLLFDIDHFKQINDSFGHVTGDNVLALTAARLFDLFPSNDIIGRMGGDEFAVFISNIPTVANVFEKAQLLRDALHTDVYCEGNAHTISISIGISLYPQHGRTFHELYSNADTALYEAKAHGRNCYALYSIEKNHF